MIKSIITAITLSSILVGCSKKIVDTTKPCPKCITAEALRYYEIKNGEARYSLDGIESKCSGQEPGDKAELTVYTAFKQKDPTTFIPHEDRIKIVVFNSKGNDEVSSPRYYTIKINAVQPIDRQKHVIEYEFPKDFDKNKHKILVGFEPAIAKR